MLDMHCNKKIITQVFLFAKERTARLARKLMPMIGADGWMLQIWQKVLMAKEWNPFFNCAKVQGCLLVYWRNSLYAKNQDVNGPVWRCLYFDRMSPLRGLDEAELCLKLRHPVSPGGYLPS